MTVQERQRPNRSNMNWQNINCKKFTVGTSGYHINYVNIDSSHEYRTFGAESQGSLVANEREEKAVLFESEPNTNLFMATRLGRKCSVGKANFRYRRGLWVRSYP